MKHFCYSILLTVLVNMIGVHVFASESFYAKNKKGVDFYFTTINDDKELAVTSGSWYGIPMRPSLTFYGIVEIPEEVTHNNITRKVTSIGTQAFAQQEKLTTVIIPSTVTQIGKKAFRNSGINYLNIPESITSIGESAFFECQNLTAIDIPDNVTSLAGGVFWGCSNLTSVTIGNGVASFGNSAFFECGSLETVTLGKNITSIGEYAFYECSSLTSIIIPDGVKTIGCAAFYGCTSLSSMIIPENVTSIDDGAFIKCSSLTSITIPQNVASIGESAFDKTNMTTVVSHIEDPFVIKGINDNRRTFSESTFRSALLYVPIGTIDKYKATEGWKDFRNIVEGTGPNGGGETPVKNFKDCIYEAGINNNWGAKEQPLYSANKDGIYRGFFYAQEADWSAGRGAFKFTGASNSWEEGDYGLGHINADGLSGTLIDDENSGNIYATPGFYRADVNLGNMTYELTPINSISIIGSTLSEGWDVDAYLTYNPETLAWEGTMKLKAGEFKFRANGSWDINWGGSINNLIQDDSNLKIHEAGTYFIQFFPLCETKSYATLTLVSDPTPDDYPTSGSCGETVNYQYDKVTQTLTISGKGAIFDYDDGSNKAPWSAYADEIRKIEIESGITSIGYFAFYKCSGITSLSIPATVGYIGSSAFEDCTALTSLSLNDGLLSIGGSAFEGCSGLQTLSIPSTVNSISINAFKNCKGITDVYCYAVTVPDTHFDAFDAAPTEKSMLHVPANSVETYRTSWPWSDFKEIVPIEEEGPDAIQGVKLSDDLNGEYYDLTGRRVYNPQKGLYIRNGKKIIVK